MTAARDISAAWRRTERVLRRSPGLGLQPDDPAVSTWTDRLRVVTRGASGGEVATDLPPVLGGAGGAVTPGWLLRAGLASCLATCIAALAAREGLELAALEVEAVGRSDARGLFGLADADGAPVDPGPRDIELQVRIQADGVAPDRLRRLVAAAQAISPVTASLAAPRPVALVIEAIG